MIKNALNGMARASLLLAALVGVASTAHASIFNGSNLEAVITSGALPDSPAARVDPNTPASAFSGVVSINIRYDNLSYICSGALIDSWHVVTAGHCVDTDGNGHVVDINKAGNDVRVVFNAGSANNGNAIITANKVDINPFYQGFGNCPVGVAGFCVNDDVAVVRLSQAAPVAAQRYSIYNGAVSEGTTFTMVGYGTSGDGINGFNVAPNFRVKRSGQNVYDLTDLNDEQNFLGGAAEVWYADFDGTNSNGVAIDTFCNYGVCGASLGNGIESGIGGGDSGGPSFVNVNGTYELVANNTFTGWFAGQTQGTFGTYMGGILLDSYVPWITTTAVPEPGSLALLALGLAGLASSRRRRA